MELERELDDLNERLEEQGGATQAQVCKHCDRKDRKRKQMPEENRISRKWKN